MSRSRIMTAAAVGISLFALLVPASVATAAPRTTVAKPAAATTAAPYVTVTLLAVNGSGCPAGSTSAVPNDAGTAFTVLFSQFMAQGGSFKNCQAIVKVAVPKGWSYTIYQVDNRGFAQLDAGASGLVQSTAYFTGYSWTMKDTRVWTGPFLDSWQTTVLSNSEVWSPCSATDFNLAINDVISVTGPSTSAMAMFSKDVKASTIFYLKWRAC